MPLIVQTDESNIEANSYVDLAFADKYHADRAHTTWAGATEDARNAALILGADYINKRFRAVYKGKLVAAANQAFMAFPRVGLTDTDGTELPSGVPYGVKLANAEAALRIVGGLKNFLPDYIPNKDASLDESDVETTSDKVITSEEDTESSQVGDIRTSTTKKRSYSSNTTNISQHIDISAKGVLTFNTNDALLPEFPDVDLFLQPYISTADLRTAAVKSAPISTGEERPARFGDDFLDNPDNRRIGGRNYRDGRQW